MGPLAGYKIIEFAGIGPGPFCAMMLAEIGPRVVRVSRPNQKLLFGFEQKNNFVIVCDAFDVGFA